MCVLCTLRRQGCGVPGKACRKMGGVWHVGLILPGLPRSPLGGGEGARQVRCGCMAGEEVNRDSGSKQLGVQLVLVKGSPTNKESPSTLLGVESPRPCKGCDRAFEPPG